MLQVNKPLDGDQLCLQCRVRGWSGRQQQHLNRRVLGDVKVVFTVVAGDQVGLDLDLAVGTVRSVINPPVVAVTLDEDQPEATAGEANNLAGSVAAAAVDVVVGVPQTLCREGLGAFSQGGRVRNRLRPRRGQRGGVRSRLASGSGRTRPVSMTA